jgi:hypothetical protein
VTDHALVVSSRGPDTAGPESVRKDTRLLLVSNDAMRARRRPIAIFAYYIYQLALSLLVAWPVSRALAGVFAGHPHGDAVLFDPGGWALLAIRTSYDRASPAISGLLLLVVVFGSVLGVVPLAALLTSLSHVTPETRAPRPRHLAPYVVATFRPLAKLLAMGSALELVLLAIAWWAFGAAREAAEPRWGDARADQLGALALAFVLLLLGLAAVLHDLARAGSVRFRTGALGAIRAALLTLRRAPGRVTWSWTWRALAQLAIVAVVALVVPHLGTRGAASVLAIAILHQLVMAARTALRASWLARALRAVDAHGSARSR